MYTVDVIKSNDIATTCHNLQFASSQSVGQIYECKNQNAVQNFATEICGKVVCNSLQLKVFIIHYYYNYN